MNITSLSSSASLYSASAQSAQALQTKPSQDQKALLQAVKTVNASDLLGGENELTFKIDRAAGIAVVRIVNRETGELVQQIPNEQVLKMAEESSGG